MNSSFEKAQLAYKNRHFSKSIAHYQKFIEIAEKLPHEDSRVLTAIDHLGRIYLSIRHKPEMAIQLLTKFADHPGLNTAENEEIHEWIEVARQRELAQKNPKEITNPDHLYEIGKQYFNQAFEKSSLSDSTSRKQLEIAESYFLQLIENHESSNHIAETYFMMGIIEKNIFTQNKWAEHFYLKEAIRKAPHTPIAQKAFEYLYKEIHKENSLTGLDKTPESVEKSLEKYRELSNPKKQVTN